MSGSQDSWYSSRENLKFLKNEELGVLMGVAKNRQVSINGGEYTQVQNLEIPDDGLVVYLKKFGNVKVFRRRFKNEAERYYIMYLPQYEEIKLLANMRANLPLIAEVRSYLLNRRQAQSHSANDSSNG